MNTLSLRTAAALGAVLLGTPLLFPASADAAPAGADRAATPSLAQVAHLYPWLSHDRTAYATTRTVSYAYGDRGCLTDSRFFGRSHVSVTSYDASDHTTYPPSVSRVDAASILRVHSARLASAEGFMHTMRAFVRRCSAGTHDDGAGNTATIGAVTTGITKPTVAFRTHTTTTGGPPADPQHYYIQVFVREGRTISEVFVENEAKAPARGPALKLVRLALADGA